MGIYSQFTHQFLPVERHAGVRDLLSLQITATHGLVCFTPVFLLAKELFLSLCLTSCYKLLAAMPSTEKGQIVRPSCLLHCVLFLQFLCTYFILFYIFWYKELNSWPQSCQVGDFLLSHIPCPNFSISFNDYFVRSLLAPRVLLFSLFLLEAVAFQSLGSKYQRG